ncbi:MAG: phosphohydrolase [Puia sp.]|nr:phosphohydrolase [Puia sp.]
MTADKHRQADPVSTSPGQADLGEWETRFIRYLRDNHTHEDGAHDLGHFHRVWNSCLRISEAEGGKGDPLTLLAASYFHDLVSLPKNHPERSRSSVLSAEATARILAADFPDFPAVKINGVKHAIEAHSFSAGIPPLTFEAKVLQDADRMEALGAIGIARTFYVAGLMHSGLFHEQDPLGDTRTLDDTRYALDHFPVKLLTLPDRMQTAAGKAIAHRKAELLVSFRDQIAREALGEE